MDDATAAATSTSPSQPDAKKPKMTPHEAKRFLLNHLARMPGDVQYGLHPQVHGAQANICVGQRTYVLTAVSDPATDGTFLAVHMGPDMLAQGTVSESGWTKAMEAIVAKESTLHAHLAGTVGTGTLTDPVRPAPGA